MYGQMTATKIGTGYMGRYRFGYYHDHCNYIWCHADNKIPLWTLYLCRWWKYGNESLVHSGCKNAKILVYVIMVYLQCRTSYYNKT